MRKNDEKKNYYRQIEDTLRQQNCEEAIDAVMNAACGYEETQKIGEKIAEALEPLGKGDGTKGEIGENLSDIFWDYVTDVQAHGFNAGYEIGFLAGLKAMSGIANTPGAAPEIIASIAPIH